MSLETIDGHGHFLVSGHGQVPPGLILHIQARENRSTIWPAVIDDSALCRDWLIAKGETGRWFRATAGWL